ncbi:MAG: hypothetical protein KDE19_21760, partial [Caldilineaceae bacterium]|nr:hypothetical protein [Caldilineaceae bacterium]
MSRASYWGRKVFTLLVIPLLFTIGIMTFVPTDAAFAQDDGQISGTIYHDVVGAANPADFTTFATPAKVSLFKGSTYITTTTTDASGHYTFTGLAGSSNGVAYVVAVDNVDELSGFTDSQGMGA